MPLLVECVVLEGFRYLDSLFPGVLDLSEAVLFGLRADGKARDVAREFVRFLLSPEKSSGQYGKQPSMYSALLLLASSLVAGALVCSSAKGTGWNRHPADFRCARSFSFRRDLDNQL